MERVRSSRFWILASVLLLILAAQCLHAAWTNGQTVDETYFSGSSYPMVRYNNYEFLGEQPPLISQIGALPLLLIQPAFPIHNFVRLSGTSTVDISKTGALFLYKMGNNPHLILFLERLPIIFLTVLLGLGIAIFGRALWGDGGGLLSLTLFSFDPNIIAHGSLYTTDMGLTVFYFFSIFTLKCFFDAPTDRRVLLLGLACGAAFMSKISGLILLPVISSLFLIFYVTSSRDLVIQTPGVKFEKWLLGIAFFLTANAIGEKQAMVLFGPFLVFAVYLYARDTAAIRSSKAFCLLLKALAIGGAILCLVYSVRLKKKYGVSASTFLVIGDLVALSIAIWFTRLASKDTRITLLKFYLAVWVFAALVIVLGYTDIAYKIHRFIGFGNFTRPLGIVLNHSKGGHGVCVDGSFVTCDWRYFPGVLSVKTPLIALLLAISGFFILLFSRKSIWIKSLILVPLGLFLGAAMMNKINIGLRHILPVYPFLILLAGYSGSLIGKIKRSIMRIPLAIALCGLIVLSAARNVAGGPDHLAYFNELVGGPEQGAKLVADSNLNWGQDNIRLAEFVLAKRMPSVKIMAEAMNPAIYDYYKIPWKPYDPEDLINPAPGFYALGIGYYTEINRDQRQATSDKRPVSWFRGKKPLYMVGKTFYVFEVPERGLQTKDWRPVTTNYAGTRAKS